MFVTPRQIAQATGLSESTVKRWCDRGILPVRRTPGGHRRMLLAEVIQVLRQRKLPLVNAGALGLPAPDELLAGGLAGARQKLLEALLRADRETVSAILHALVVLGVRMSTLGDKIVAPVFRKIGELWSCQSLEVYEERQACVVAEEALRELKHFFEPLPAHSPLAIGGALSGDAYVLPHVLVELTLLENGWQPRYLGSNLPVETLIKAIQQIQPELFWLSVSHAAEPATVAASTRQLAEVAQTVRCLFVIGGQELTEELQAQVDCSVYCADLAQLDRLLRTIPVTARRAEPKSVPSGSQPIPLAPASTESSDRPQ